MKLKEVPFKVRLFKLVATNGDIDWVITNCPDETVTAQVAQDANDVRWQVEELHRGLKQLTGSEKCQCRKARSQRNHLACCYHAWLSLRVKAKHLDKTLYQVKTDLLHRHCELPIPPWQDAPSKKLAWGGYNGDWSPDKLRPCSPWCVAARLRVWFWSGVM